MADSGVLLDTSFFLRFLKENDPLFKSADGYYKYFLRKDMPMFVSTISVGEYCVGGDASELPLKDLQILPFNFDHAKRAGEFARIIFQNKNKLKVNERNIIPNDSKLFAQADVEQKIDYYLSSDSESLKIYGLLKSKLNPRFQFIDLKMSYAEFFGVLGFE